MKCDGTSISMTDTYEPMTEELMESMERLIKAITFADWQDLVNRLYLEGTVSYTNLTWWRYVHEEIDRFINWMNNDVV